MRLTAFTDYSLRVLIYLATQPGRRATIDEIAAAFHVKRNHLTKVAHFLGKEGLLDNVRGKGGGLDLARDPKTIGIGDVVRRTEGAAVPAECFGDKAHHCRIVRQCGLRDVLREAVDAFQRVLGAYTLEDLVANRPALARVMFVERAAAAPRRSAARAATTAN